VDHKSSGITVEWSGNSDFIDWPVLKGEIEMMLLPQVRVVPNGSTVEVGDLGDRKNWIVRILDSDRHEIGHVWFGSNPDLKWEWDGLVRLGDSNATDKSPGWQSFQRFSDGSYRRLETNVVSK